VSFQHLQLVLALQAIVPSCPSIADVFVLSQAFSLFSAFDVQGCHSSKTVTIVMMSAALEQ